MPKWSDLTTRFKCVVCGKLTVGGRLPREGRLPGDGSERYPRRHIGSDGLPCAGNTQHAEWVDVND